MKHTPSSVIGLAVLASVSLVGSASAVVTIDYVPVGNAGNANDTTGFGAVAYNYQIAKNETTIGQYSEFLNAAAKSDPYALYNPQMADDTPTAGISRVVGSSGSYEYSVIGSSGNKPIAFVDWFDAARFCNWMQNGQGSGSTETGAYTLNGAMNGIYLKNSNATVWVPSEDEWYKAAYYDPTKGGTGGYWLYPTQSDALGGNTIGIPNSANCFYGWFASSPWGTTDVGAYGANSESFYGTNDQGGNVFEWNDAVGGGELERVLRGGSWQPDWVSENDNFYYLSSWCSFNDVPYGLSSLDFGFRVASVPEPSCVVLPFLLSGMLVTRRKR